MEDSGRCTRRLLGLLGEHRLYHVKTLCCSDAPGALEWLGAKSVDLCEPRRGGENLVAWLTRLCGLCGVDTDKVEICSVDAKPRVRETTERLVVCVERTWFLGRDGSLVLFSTVGRNAPSQKNDGVRSLCAAANAILGAGGFEYVARRVARGCECSIRPKEQGSAPVLRSLRPERYDTVPPTTPIVTADSFGRRSEPEAPTRSSEKWTLRAVPETASATAVDLESLLRDGKSVLGRGGFGVTVRIEEGLVAKVNLFPEMLNWSLPVVEDEFKRYAHVATQMEEVLIGASIKHPNVLRTFGGLWCEAPGYPLGGRVVSLMEEAACSLHEFSAHMGTETRYVPLVELDVLRALDHLRSRAIQHRDITHRNVLVCRAESRRPLPLVFKISDFGTACNFSTPDQPRGTRANRAPEVLWCLESDTQADVFSWYCMIWELYSGAPLIGHRASGQREGFCSRTYARNLSELLGTYEPTSEAAFDSYYMKSLDAMELRRQFRSRPRTRDVAKKLEAAAARASGRAGPDPEFVAIGAACVTLFPQERWSASELLELPRYRDLGADAVSVPAREIPTNIGAGCYRACDAVACEDCEPPAFRVPDTSSLATTFRSESKIFYGVDVIRLAPGYIQPYVWYSRKASASSQVAKEDSGRVGRSPERLTFARMRIGSPEPDPCSASASSPAGGPRVIVKGKSGCCEGEVDTKMAILTQASPEDAERFREHVVELSIAVTEQRPDLFAGPIRGLCRSSESCDGVVVFQYAPMFADCKKASEWTLENAPFSADAFAAQVLLTLHQALEAEKLPTRALNLDDLLICRGCALIDPVAYLAKHFGRGGPFFGVGNEGLLTFCIEVLGRCGFREADSISLLSSRDPVGILGGALGILSERAGRGRPVVPSRLTLDSAYFAFEEYTAERSTWRAEPSLTGTKYESGRGLGLLVFGNPPPRRGKQTLPGPPSDSKSLSSLIRNLTLRLKVRVFESHKVEVVAFNCTRAPLTVDLSRAGLRDVAGVDLLSPDRVQLSRDGRCYTHDADPRVALGLLKWAPVVMISKHAARSPVPELTKVYYRIVIALVRLCGNGASESSLVDLFARLSPLIVSTHLRC
ncbi:uncharacterized protein LOC144996328 [Oryzias latipes]